MSETLLVLVLGLIAVGAIAFPLLAGRERYHDPAMLEADVRRYREALRAGTVCGRCREANPRGATYCGSCGEGLG